MTQRLIVWVERALADTRVCAQIILYVLFFPPAVLGISITKSRKDIRKTRTQSRHGGRRLRLISDGME